MLATLPELILGAGALVLLMVAAWAGDRHTKLISWLSVLLVAAAGPGERAAGRSAAGSERLYRRHPAGRHDGVQHWNFGGDPGF
mgnify:CR=1 FL=1